MSTIIAGRFDTQAAAEQALEALRSVGFQRDEIETFYVSPPGNHETLPTEPSGAVKKGTEGAGRNALIGAALGGAAGLAIGATAGAAASAIAIGAAIGGAGVGAYTSSLGGALKGAGDPEGEELSHEELHEHPGGMMVAARVDREGTAEQALRVLREAGARDIERANGEWRDGSWQDFDPAKSANLIEPERR